MKNDEVQAKSWWADLYDDLLADILLENTSSSEIEATLDFLKSALCLSKGDLLFDQCCGTGRLSVPLAEKGFQVIGIDLIDSYVESAQKRASELGVQASFIAADAFQYESEVPCAGAFNWWTSFGYEASDEKNLLMLGRAFRSISPGGYYALDFMNVPGVIYHFKPEVVTRGMSKADGEILLVRESHCDIENGIMHKKWDYFLESGRRVQHHSTVRLYDPPTLKRLFETAGFRNIRIFGDLDESKITLNSPRCIILAQRPD